MSQVLTVLISLSITTISNIEFQSELEVEILQLI